MKAKDVMTPNVVCVAPDAPVREALQLMLQRNISGLPVVDQGGSLCGIVTEGDFLRRAETGTERKRPRWLEFLLGPGRIAEDYVRTHARRVEEVMTTEVATVDEDAALDAIVSLMEKHRIKRVPVMRGDKVVGIVSRANLLHALAGIADEIAPGPKDDETIRNKVLAELDRQKWAPRQMIDVVVRNGVVELWGTVFDARERDAARVAAETVPGVKTVRSHLTWIEPMSGMVFSDPNDEAAPATSTPPRNSNEKLAANG
jgi:CBS domain-containing protein